MVFPQSFYQRSLFASCAVLALAALIPGTALAQSTSALRYAPPVVRVDGGGHITTTESGVERREADRTKVLVPELRAVVFVDKPGAVKKTGARASGLVVATAPDAIPEAARAAADKYLGGAVTLGTLDDMTHDLVLAYRSADMPVVNVVIPEQEITNGVVQVLVVVGRLDKVRVEGASGADADAIAREIGLKPGEPISEGQVLEDLRFLNRNPFRHIDALYQPGKTYGQTDLVLQDTQDKPWTVYAGAATQGGRGPLGDLRPNIGAMEFDQLGLGETIGYQYTTDDLFNRLKSSMVSLNLPLADRWQFQTILGYTYTRAKLENGALDQGGISTIAGGYLTTALPRLGAWANDLRLGFEYKSTNNNLDYGGATVVSGHPEIFQGVLGYAGEGVFWGTKTRFDVSVYESPGQIGPEGTSADYQKLRADAQSNYTYAKAHLDNRWEIDGGWRLLTSINSQLASTNLLPTEAFILGGLGSVRGFAFQDALVDSGVTTNATFYTPGTQVLRTLSDDKSMPIDELRAYIFLDHGSGWYHFALPAQSDYVGMTGAGVRPDLRTGEEPQPRCRLWLASPGCEHGRSRNRPPAFPGRRPVLIAFSASLKSKLAGPRVPAKTLEDNMKNTAHLLCAGAFLLAGVALAGAANAAEPDSSSLAFQDWTVNCAAAPAKAEAKPGEKAAAAAPICEIVQSFIDKQSRRLVARVAIGRSSTVGDLKLVIQAPVGIWLPEGATLAVGDKLQAKANYLRCSTSACFAETEVKKDFVEAAKTAEKMTLTMSQGVNQPLLLNVSTKGFAGAVAALEKK